MNLVSLSLTFKRVEKNIYMCVILDFVFSLNIFKTAKFLITDPTVRDCSAEALGTAMKVVGEKAIMAYIGELDNLKQAKVRKSVKIQKLSEFSSYKLYFILRSKNVVRKQ